MKYRLEQWSVGGRPDDGFTPPECQVRCLQGRRSDGRKVVTSGISRVDGRTVETASGSVYELGEPAPEYLRYLESIGYAYDPERPIRVVRRES